MYSKINKSKSIAILASLTVIANMTTFIGSASDFSSYGEDEASPGVSSSSSDSQATTYNINEGDIKLTSGGTYIIKGDGSQTSNMIIIEGDPESPWEYNITLNNVNINTVSDHGIWIQQGANVNLDLIGENTIGKSIFHEGVLRIDSDPQSGSLKIDGEITGSYYDASFGDIIIENGDFEIDAILSADVTINSGKFKINGVLTGQNVTINGGNFAESHLNISSGGYITINGGIFGLISIYRNGKFGNK